jgi:ABC-2 type transport system ATP-binding protein
MLTTLLRPTSGKATVCGFDIVKHANNVRQSIGVVPQEYTADEDMTGYENIIFFAALYGIPKDIAKKRAEELLELVGLKESANKKVMNYSGGMRRWLEICDRIAIIEHGKIIKIGSPSELKASIGGDVIEVGVLEREPDLSQMIMKVGYVKDVKRLDGYYRIKSDAGEMAAPAIIEIIRSNGYHVTRISLSKPSLDQVYLEYTGRSLRDEQADSTDIIAQRFTLRRARS